MQSAAQTLDPDLPVALLLPATLSFVNDEDAYRMMTRFIDAVASGSYVVLTHPSDELRSEGMQEAANSFSKLLADSYFVRSGEQIAQFVAGLDIIDPGLVQIDRWRPAGPGPEADTDHPPTPIYGAVARKP
jgi:S-adenosyl methyltransferase